MDWFRRRRARRGNWAAAVARDLGLTHWDGRHASDAFKFTRRFALTAIRNTVAFWNREKLGIELTPGVDEVSLALVADALVSNPYRSRRHTDVRRRLTVETSHSD